MEKLLPVERIFEELEQNGFHQPKKSVSNGQKKEFVVKTNLH